MNTIEAYEKDIELQLDFLKKKSLQKQKTLSANQQRNVIFSGSGDSLVSAMLAESFSPTGTVKAMDPLDLYKNKHLVKSKHVYFVSISGNTITNIKVAKIVKKSIAITSKPKSRLAKASDQTICLVAPNNDVFTAGSISFLESALTCISLVREIFIPTNVDQLFLKASTDAKKAVKNNNLSNKKNKIFVLGTLFTYPLAMYCAAKFYEILGYDAHYCRIEQFSHMELFSAKKGDTVILFEQKNSHNKQLAANLKKVGINVVVPQIPSMKKRTPEPILLSQIIYCAFFSQLIALFEAKKQNKKDCHFVTAKKIRNVSNQMIY